jgi:protein-S-isoprenylcysteine O-methyltransferase Ste14
MLTTIARREGVPQFLDRFERIVVVCLYLFLVYRFANAVVEAPINGVYLITELVVMLMVLCRRSTDHISASPVDWIIAFGGTFASMMLIPGTKVEAVGLLPEVLLFVGIAISFGAKLQLRRSFGIVAANRGVKKTGLYAMVRHPMYLGYFFVQGGMLLLNFGSWNLAVLSFWAVLQIERVRAEENMLALDPVYRTHMQTTKYRLLPLVY